MKLYLLLSLAYLCGSIPFGVLISHRCGVDIQHRGSGNIGFANVRRVLGWKAGLLTLAGDIAKGVIPVWLAVRFAGPGLAFWVGLIAITGHLFPIWLRFKGGKGIATGLGTLIILQPLAAAAGVVVYLVGCKFLRKSAPSSLLAIIAVLIVGSLVAPSDAWHYGLLLMVALWTLRKNLTGRVPNYDH